MCHNNKDGRVQRILSNSYGQPIISDMWNSQFPYRFCNKDHKHPEYGRVLTGNSNGKKFTFINMLSTKFSFKKASFCFPFPADKRGELFCHEPLTGNLLRSDTNRNGEFKEEQTFKEGFCQVRTYTNCKIWEF